MYINFLFLKIFKNLKVKVETTTNGVSMNLYTENLKSVTMELKFYILLLIDNGYDPYRKNQKHVNFNILMQNWKTRLKISIFTYKQIAISRKW